MGMMNKTTASYVAGLLDGEGSFCIWTVQKEYGRQHRYAVMMSNTNRAICEWLKNSFGGSFIVKKLEPIERNRKQVFYWHLSNKDILDKFLLVIIPYLKIKKRAAQILYEFIKTYNSESYVYLGYMKGQAIKQDVFNKRMELYKELKLINSRGLQPKRLSEANTFKGVYDSLNLQEK